MLLLRLSNLAISESLLKNACSVLVLLRNFDSRLEILFHNFEVCYLNLSLVKLNLALIKFGFKAFD